MFVKNFYAQFRLVRAKVLLWELGKVIFFISIDIVLEF